MRRKVESWWDSHGYNEDGTAEIGELLATKVFNHTKPKKLLQHVVNMATKGDDLVMDFFAGSGTTGHAVYAQNDADDSTRRFVLVQLPEPLDPQNSEQKAASNFCDLIGKKRTIAELTKERLRRGALKIKATSANKKADLGFRSFKLAHSNIRAWNPTPTDLEQAVIEYQDHVLEGRTESDILYELLLKLGLDLCVPIEVRKVAGKDVYAVGGGVLMTCLTPAIVGADVDALATGIVAWQKELAPAGNTTCVFLDSAFADDVAKTNLAAILEQHGIQNVRSL